jgi:hypothetical protein
MEYDEYSINIFMMQHRLAAAGLYSSLLQIARRENSTVFRLHQLKPFRGNSATGNAILLAFSES